MSGHQDPVIVRARHERARREMFLGAVRSDLEEKPTPAAVRAAARRWCQAITAISADIVNDQRQRAA